MTPSSAPVNATNEASKSDSESESSAITEDPQSEESDDDGVHSAKFAPGCFCIWVGEYPSSGSYLPGIALCEVISVNRHTVQIKSLKSTQPGTSQQYVRYFECVFVCE